MSARFHLYWSGIFERSRSCANPCSVSAASARSTVSDRAADLLTLMTMDAIVVRWVADPDNCRIAGLQNCRQQSHEGTIAGRVKAGRSEGWKAGRLKVGSVAALTPTCAA